MPTTVAAPAPLVVGDFDFGTTIVVQERSIVYKMRLNSKALIASATAMYSGASPPLPPPTVESTSEGMDVAVKSVRKDSLSSADVADLQREKAVMMHVAASLSRELSASICAGAFPTLFATLQDETRVHLVMTYFRGCGLQRLFYEHPRGLSLPLCVHIVRSVALRLRWLHREAGVMFRDVKLPNVLIRSDGSVCLVDFGSAWCVAHEGGRFPSVPSGTLHTRAPEMGGSGRQQAVGASEASRSVRTYGYSCDFWSLGVLAFEIACGAPPFGTFEVCGADAETRKLRPTFPELPSTTAVSAHGGNWSDYWLVVRALLSVEPAARFGCDWDAVLDARGLQWPTSAASCSAAVREAIASYAEEIDDQMLGL